MIVLLALGIAVAIVGYMMVAEEWRRSGTQNARLNKFGLSLEVVGVGGLLLGLGVVMGYVGVGA
jgi:hypothetical protein